MCREVLLLFLDSVRDTEALLNNLQEFNQGGKALYYVQANAHPLFLSSCVTICMSSMNMSNESLQRIISSMWCSICAPEESWMWLRSSQQKLYAKVGLQKNSTSSQVMIQCVPLKVKANCSCRKSHWTEEHTSKTSDCKVFASCWLGGGQSWPEQSDTIIHRDSANHQVLYHLRSLWKTQKVHDYSSRTACSNMRTEPFNSISMDFFLIKWGWWGFLLQVTWHFNKHLNRDKIII